MDNITESIKLTIFYGWNFKDSRLKGVCEFIEKQTSPDVLYVILAILHTGGFFSLDELKNKLKKESEIYSLIVW